MAGLKGFRTAVSQIFGSAFFLSAALVSMAIWLLILLFGLYAIDMAEHSRSLTVKFPIDVSPYKLPDTVSEQFSSNTIYIGQCILMVLLVLGIWSYQFVRAGSARGQTRLSKLKVWTISCMFVVFYGFLLPTVLFILNSEQLTHDSVAHPRLHDIQLYVLDQFFRSVMFDILEAMDFSLSGLDYADDADLGFKVLVTIYRVSVPMWVFMVWRRVRTPRSSVLSRSAVHAE